MLVFVEREITTASGGLTVFVLPHARWIPIGFCARGDQFLLRSDKWDRGLLVTVFLRLPIMGKQRNWNFCVHKDSVGLSVGGFKCNEINSRGET